MYCQGNRDGSLLVSFMEGSWLSKEDNKSFQLRGDDDVTCFLCGSLPWSVPIGLWGWGGLSSPDTRACECNGDVSF